MRELNLSILNMTKAKTVWIKYQENI